MLPSTGYFKGINCPFYDSGLCERPYCHFRHVKKESFGTDSIENGDILQKLVTKVVQKVLQQSESSDASSLANSITDATKDQLQNASVLTATKATYNPTPICKLNKINNSDTENNDELNEQRKRHIPVPYTPRKPSSIPIKRPVDSDDYKPFIYNPPPVKYTPGSADSSQLDPYTPKGAVESKEKYLPGTETEIPEYAPKETQTNVKRSYIPSDRSGNKKKLLEYKPAKITQKNEITSVTYQPTPCALVPCFSSDEEEPAAKKPRLSSDLNGLDELGAEFDILDQIFDEEKLERDIVKGKLKTYDVSHDVSNTSVPSNKETSSEEKKKSSNVKNKSSKEKQTLEKREKSENKHEKSKSSHKKSDHKSSSSKEKDKEKKREKEKSIKDRSKDREKEKDKGRDKNKDRDKNKSKEKEKDKSSNKKQSSSKTSHKSSRHSNSSLKHSSHSDKSSKHKEKHNHNKHKKSKEKNRQSRKSKEEESNGISLSEHESDNMDNCEQDIEKHDEDIYEISESDEESIALECKRIFEEYVPTEKPVTKEAVSKLEENNENEYLSGKKRVSRAVDVKITPKVPVKPDYKVSAAQAMAERLAKVREYHANKKAVEPQKNEEINVVTPKIIPSTLTGASKIRIAHVPYASTLMNAKRTISTIPKTASVKSDPSTSSTITQTVKKGEKRVAHVPNDKFIDRPGVLEPLASKIPANIRTTYLNMMIDECLKIYILVNDAYARAQHEELNTSKKCSSVQIYKNSAVLTVSRLRKELQECKGVKKSGADCNMLQRIPQGISGSSGNASSWSIETKNRKSYENIQEYRGAKLYHNIQKWILTEEQLQENGFPRSHTSGEKGRAIIYNQKKQKPPIGNIRTCCRCRKEYTVNKKSFPTVKEECIYHPNNKYRVRGEAKYQCCSQDATSDGCCVAPTHVYEYVDYENLKGYVKTMPPERQMDDYGVFSLDCEMCYTTHGLDLTRVTVINADCKVVYETLIKPLHPITDYNTRYSGITEEQMADVKTTLLEVQATLLTMFNSKTILIGHSLESDFKALKLIHDTVIDTSVLFPHKMGPPYKRALRNLCSEHLKKIIQNSVDGHDSAEDATVCMELIHYKLKEHLKTR